jgi:alginate O-acetyltransferase complex protein AlgI
MLFNSFGFIAVFVPVTLLGFAALVGVRRRLAVAWLVLASLFFYAGWSLHSLQYVALLLGSAMFNFVVGRELALRRFSPERMRLIFWAAIFANLALLGFFKYTNFAIGSLNDILGTTFGRVQLDLPIGISFYTFTQIAFLVDVWRKQAREHRADSYLLFVSYFPHLIAGPIIHHSQVIPQFEKAKVTDFGLALGLCIFVIGLSKKVLLADSFAPYADLLFLRAEEGTSATLVQAWVGLLCYSLQLYFDFSGYCDMAIGVSLLFGVRLPVNFNSPYKATSIIEFWQCWHITLSRFLRDYLYIPLGGNRAGSARRYLNLMITMLLGGLWHGASWSFVIWGGLHGVYLAVNHGWRGYFNRRGAKGGSTVSRTVGLVSTFLAVVVAWAFFRAKTLSGALTILGSAFGVNQPAAADPFKGTFDVQGAAWLVAMGLSGVWLLPNTQQLFNYHADQSTVGSGSGVIDRPSIASALAVGALFCWALSMMGKVSPFLYYQF